MSFRINRSVEIDAPAEVVWNVITDFASYGEWNPFVPRCESTLEPGSAISMDVQLGGKKLSRQVEWITARDDGRGFSYRMRPLPLGTLSSARVHRIEALEGSRCRYHSHFELRGWLMPLVRAVMDARLDKGFSGMTQGIKRRAEALWNLQQQS